VALVRAYIFQTWVTNGSCLAIAAGSPGRSGVGTRSGLPDNIREGKGSCGDIVVVGGDCKSSEKRSENRGDLGPLAADMVVVIDDSPGVED
jgi:hypothetical protein